VLAPQIKRRRSIRLCWGSPTTLGGKAPGVPGGFSALQRVNREVPNSKQKGVSPPGKSRITTGTFVGIVRKNIPRVRAGGGGEKRNLYLRKEAAGKTGGGSWKVNGGQNPAAPKQDKSGRDRTARSNRRRNDEGEGGAWTGKNGDPQEETTTWQGD